MNKKDAWKNFIKTGDISDYLEFCKFKQIEEAQNGKELKSEWNNNSRK